MSKQSPARHNQTAAQQDYAVFLPALSTFYSTYVGRQRFGPYVDASRIPQGFENGVEGLNYLNPDQGYFAYKWSLYSAGHANLDLGVNEREDMIRNRDESSWLLGDSGGFQIGKGVWEGDWRPGSGCPRAQEKREKVLRWMDAYMDYGMTLDIPGWVGRTPRGREATCISTYEEAVAATKYNYQYWLDHRNGRCRFLTVLQGDNHRQSDDWYEEMKDFCNPKRYPDRHFNGWAMGSQNKCDLHLALRRLVFLQWDGLLEEGKQDWVHFLGTSKLEWAMAFTQIQRAIRRHHNPSLTISYDCASPFLATANGQVYYENRLTDNGKWSYRMSKCVDNKAYARDTRLFRDALLNDLPNDWPGFINSPIMERTQMRDICHYASGDLNKIGKEGRTSWDSFSYAILMAHNIWCHIEAVQEGNRLMDQGVVPFMLREHNNPKECKPETGVKLHNSAISLNYSAYHDTFFRDLVDAIFSANSRDKALKLLDKHDEWYMDMVGSSANGFLGRKAKNSTSKFQQLMDVTEINLDELTARDDSGIDNAPLDQLEDNQQ
jgi:hypothetical protein